jgi:predicted RNase H-like nuclease (RuvC/YqgF family)
MEINEPLALILVALVTVGGSYLTNRAANKSSRSQNETTLRGMVESARSSAEEQSYQRAKSFYEGVIERQDHEIAELERDVVRLKNGLATCGAKVDALTAELAVAKRTLRLRDLN